MIVRVINIRTVNFIITYVNTYVMKKDTMLTLDERVTEAAKSLGLNLSDIAERALKEELKANLRPSGEEMIHFPVTKKLRLKNIGPFEGEREFEFSPGFNLIVGPNASGKSTLIDCLRTGYAGVEPPGRNRFVEESEESWVKIEPRNGEIERKVVNGQGEGIAGTGGYLSECIEKDRELEMPEGLKELLNRYDRSPSERGLSAGERELREILGQVMATRENECYVRDDGLGYLDLEMVEMMLKFLPEMDVQMIFTFIREPDFEIGSEYNVIGLESANLGDRF